MTTELHCEVVVTKRTPAGIKYHDNCGAKAVMVRVIGTLTETKMPMCWKHRQQAEKRKRLRTVEC